MCLVVVPTRDVEAVDIFCFCYQLCIKLVASEFASASTSLLWKMLPLPQKLNCFQLLLPLPWCQPTENAISFEQLPWIPCGLTDIVLVTMYLMSGLKKRNIQLSVNYVFLHPFKNCFRSFWLFVTNINLNTIINWFPAISSRHVKSKHINFKSNKYWAISLCFVF